MYAQKDSRGVGESLDLKTIKSKVRAILGSAKNGLTAEEVNRDYMSISGRKLLPYKDHHFANVYAFLASPLMNDACEIGQTIGPSINHKFYGKINSKTEGIARLVAEQRPGKTSSLGGVLPLEIRIRSVRFVRRMFFIFDKL